MASQRRSLSVLNLDSSDKNIEESLFSVLMKDPNKRALILTMLEKESENIKKYQIITDKENLRRQKKLKIREKLLHCESPTALLRRRVLAQSDSDGGSNSSSSELMKATCSNMELTKLLEGVNLYVEIHSKGVDRSRGAQIKAESMGANVLKNFTKEVTHVIFKDGSFSTYQRAKLMKVHLVSILWLKDVETMKMRVPEKNYPALGTEIYDVNLTQIFQEYEEAVGDDYKRSLSSAAYTSRRKTALPYELMLPSSLTFSQTAENLYHPTEPTRARISETFIPSSQFQEAESIISYPCGTLPGRNFTGSERHSEVSTPELTSDDDSDGGVIDGHSAREDRSILDNLDLTQQDELIIPLSSRLDSNSNEEVVNLQDDKKSSESTNKGSLSSDRSISLLHPQISKSTNVDNLTVVDMDLTDTVSKRNVNSKSLNLERRLSDKPSSSSKLTYKRHSCSNTPFVTKRKKSNNETSPTEGEPDTNMTDNQTSSTLSLHLEKDCGIQEDPSSESMPSLRISVSSASKQNSKNESMPSLRLSESNSDKSLSRDKLDDLPSTSKNLEPVRILRSRTKSTSFEGTPLNTKSKVTQQKIPNNNPKKPKVFRKLYNLNDIVDETVTAAAENPAKVNEPVTIPDKTDTNFELYPLLLTQNVINILKKSKKNSPKLNKQPKKKSPLIGKKNKVTPKKVVVSNSKTKVAKTSDKEKKDLGANKEADNTTTVPVTPHASGSLLNAKDGQTQVLPLNRREEEKKSKKTPIARRKSIRLQSDKDHTPLEKMPITPQLNRRSTLDFVQPSSTKSQKKPLKKSIRNSTIVCTRLHKPEVQEFIQIVKKLKRFTVENEVSKKTTHLVVGDCKRTVNLLKAIAQGCWVVKQEWLYRSLEAGKWLDEEDFELTDFSTAVRQCRMERQAFGPLYSMDVFVNCGAIYVSRNSCPRTSDLEELIEMCGGRLAETPQLANVVVGTSVRFENVKCVTEQWVLDCITCNRRKAYKKYFISN